MKLIVKGVSTSTMPESDGNMVMDTLSLGVRSDRISNTSVLDSEESLEDDAILDLDITQDDRSDQSPLFINFTCTVKSRLQQYSLSLRNIAVCIGTFWYIFCYLKQHTRTFANIFYSVHGCSINRKYNMSVYSHCNY